MAYLTTDEIKRDIVTVNKHKESNVHLLAYISDRGGRKSSAVQECVIDSALDGHPSIVIRNKTNRPITEKWLSDYEAEIVKNNNWFVYSEKVEEFKGAMTVTYLVTDVENPEDSTYILYYGMYLSVSDIYKSNYYEGWNKVNEFYFEEAVPTERLIQDERHIITNSMKQMNDLLSIVSTVSRGRDISVFLLGNDIKYNLLNPVTVSFDLLERLEVNKKIIDNAIINDIEYPFIFTYFDFPGATNHWLKVEDKKIDNTIDVNNLSFRSFGFKTSFKKYIIYYFNDKIYVSDKQPIPDKQIESKRQLLQSIGVTDYYYTPDIQIQVLLSKGTDEQKEEIRKYIDRFGHFKKPKIDKSVYYFDLTQIEKMKIHELDSMENSEAFKNLIIELETKNAIFSNFRIKTLISQLYYEFELYKKMC